MKKTACILCMIILVAQACSGSDSNTEPVPGAGTGNPPTLTSADSSNGYADTTARHSDTTFH